VRRGYLTGEEAIDVARMVGLEVEYIGCRGKAGIDGVHPDAAESALRAGHWRPESIAIDLTRLTWIDRFRVAWCRISGHYYLKQART
jgi:hypothetical protein